MKIDLKVGIVGFGGAGMAQLGHFSNIPGCQVTAVFDPNDGGLERARSMAPAILATANFAEFMASGLDAMAVCSPDSTHADYIVAALEAGTHVVCEKPLTDSLDGCRRILAAEATAGKVVAGVQHQMRFLPVHLEIKRIMDSGTLGRIGYIEGYYVHNLTTRAAVYDPWRFADNATPLVYSGCHFVDLLRWLLADEVEEVMGMANNIAFPEYPESDLNAILLRFKSGVIGKVVVAFGAGRPQDHSLRIYGSRMSIENNLLFTKDGSVKVIARPHLPKDEPPMGKPQVPFYSIRGRGYRTRLDAYRTYLLGRLFEALMHGKGTGGDYGVATYPLRLYPHALAVRASLANFVAAVRGEGSLGCSLKDAAKTVATCLAGVEAYRSGKAVKVRDFLLPGIGF